MEVFQCEIRRLHINNTPLLSCFGCYTEVVCGVKWEKRLKKPTQSNGKCEYYSYTLVIVIVNCLISSLKMNF